MIDLILKMMLIYSIKCTICDVNNVYLYIYYRKREEYSMPRQNNNEKWIRIVGIQLYVNIKEREREKKST